MVVPNNKIGNRLTMQLMTANVIDFLNSVIVSLNGS